MSNKILIFSADDKFKVLEKKSLALTKKFLTLLEKDRVEVEISFIPAVKMRQINKKYRNKDKATNILSFNEAKNFILPESKYLRLGEIYICPTLVSNYFELNNKKSPKDLLSLEELLIHGILHLLGYDHIKKSDTILMENKEREILDRLNSKK